MERWQQHCKTKGAAATAVRGLWQRLRQRQQCVRSSGNVPISGGSNSDGGGSQEVQLGQHRQSSHVSSHTSTEEPPNNGASGGGGEWSSSRG